jgi:hypothetical protein
MFSKESNNHFAAKHIDAAFREILEDTNIELDEAETEDIFFCRNKVMICHVQASIRQSRGNRRIIFEEVI